MRSRIGVIGGGQLAAMMAIAAKSLSISLAVQTADPEDSAVQYTDHFILGKVDDYQATKQLAAISDTITFENEFVDIEQLKCLEAEGAHFLPKLATLNLLIDKYSQRKLLQQLEIPVPEFYKAESATDLLTAARTLGFPAVLKARRYGYDGQGTCIVRSEAELLDAWATMQQVPVILEAWVDFVAELAVMVARSEEGDIAIYPVVETQQVKQVCQRVIAPARIEPAIATQVTIQVKHIAERLVSHLQAVGVFGIEYFLTADGKVSVNEIAPRTHNSGHYTIEGCHTSQFTQLLRAIAGMPLGKTDMTSPVAVMVNLLGYETVISDYLEKRQRLHQLPDTYVHWYGKQHSKPGRKLGHLTVLASDHERGMAIAAQAEAIWYG